MEREQLENITLEKIWQETLRYQLVVAASADRDLTIDMIHIERNNRPEEKLPLTQRSKRSLKGRKQTNRFAQPAAASDGTNSRYPSATVNSGPCRINTRIVYGTTETVTG